MQYVLHNGLIFAMSKRSLARLRSAIAKRQEYDLEKLGRYLGEAHLTRSMELERDYNDEAND